MKKTRRIEITSFRRRTTIGVNRQEDGNDVERPHNHLDISSHQVPTRQPSSESPEGIGMREMTGDDSLDDLRNGGRYGDR
jgi:hypothetical protein